MSGSSDAGDSSPVAARGAAWASSSDASGVPARAWAAASGTTGSLMALLSYTSLPAMQSQPESECLGENLIVEFLDGKLSPAATSEVERHVDRCADCRRLLAAATR